MSVPNFTWSRLLSFVGASLLVSIAPGPDCCFVLAQSLVQGIGTGLLITAGLMAGLCVHITLAVLGVAVLLERYPKVMDAISLFGAGYLFWVALGLMNLELSPEGGETLSPLGAFAQGIILNLSNPKVILFFVAFLPRFLPAQCVRRRQALFTLGGIFLLCAGFVMSAYAWVGSVCASLLYTNPSVAHVLGTAGACAIGLIACWVALPVLWKYLRKKPIN